VFPEQIQESRLQPILVPDLDGILEFSETIESLQERFEAR
jgi:hypothetical protein